MCSIRRKSQKHNFMADYTERLVEAELATPNDEVRKVALGDAERRMIEDVKEFGSELETCTFLNREWEFLDQRKVKVLRAVRAQDVPPRICITVGSCDGKRAGIKPFAYRVRAV